ncbi:MAG: hypothetical protein ACJAUJ_000090 [Salibacteraceae bacterium]|jgi:hypothetical protein
MELLIFLNWLELIVQYSAFLRILYNTRYSLLKKINREYELSFVLAKLFTTIAFNG